MRIAYPGGVTRSAVLLALFMLGCGPDFDPPSELHSLRVLAVKKDAPYAKPGATVNLDMLWQDASPLVGRAVTLAWSPPCINPPGDLYYGCFSDPSSFVGMIKQGGDNPEHTSVDIPPDIISRRPPPAEGNTAYGLAYVFFAACAGELAPLAASGDATTFPVACKDANGKLLGADDFVAGYTSIYAYESISNNNPKIDGFEFRGQPMPTCLLEDCQPLAGSHPASDFDFECDDSDHPEQSARCVPTCADDGDSSCTGYALRPSIDKNDEANQDTDDVAAQQIGHAVCEQMWIDYYTDAGGFKSSVRLLNDSTNGWNDDYGTEFYAPKKPGPLRIWAIAHDNRGGMAWSGITLKAQ